MKVWAYIAILALLIGAFSGVYHAGELVERGRHSAALNNLRIELDAKVTEKQTIIDSITTLWLEKEPEIDIRYKTIIKQIETAVPDNRACDLTPDAISLLNSAARNELPEDKHISKSVDKK